MVKRRFLILAAAMLAALVFSAAAYAETVYILCQPDSFVNVRVFPKRGADVAGRLELGDTVETDGTTRNGFLRVYGFEAGEAWVNTGLVSWEPVTVGTVEARGESNGRVACRRSINGTRRKWLYNGAEVTIYASSDGWSITNRGFIQTRYLWGFLMEYAREPDLLCMKCEHAKQRFRESCYCTKYGIIIGYSKTICGGFEREQVREPEDNDAGRNNV